MLACDFKFVTIVVTEEQTHHGSAVLHQVDANNTQKCSKAQLDIERDQSRFIQHNIKELMKVIVMTVSRRAVTHSDAWVMSSDRNIFGASFRDQTHGQHHQSQS